MSIKRPNYQEDSADSAINISPLIDVLFILLIFFIVSMVFSDRDVVDIDSPKASNTSSAKDNSVLILIDKAGDYFYESKKLSLQELERRCLQISKERNVVLMLEADANAPVQSVVSLIDMSKGVGIEEVYILTEKK